jgi:hypothetical protein
MPEDMCDHVERQVDAYNRRDIDAFLACYAATTVIEDAVGAVVMGAATRCAPRTANCSAPRRTCTQRSRRAFVWVTTSSMRSGSPGAEV